MRPPSCWRSRRSPTVEEVIVSRGELIEIGGEFRIPDIMLRSGAVLREVGATNRTHLRDYAEAITPDTALLLKVHTSNYRVVGFTAEVSSRELVELGRERGIPVMEDLGSGSLVDLRPWGFPYEPTVPETVASGVDLVSFSGDKLLGGPQAGIVVGRRAVVSRLKKNPWNRALRIDKFTIAALEATLHAYEAGTALQTVPTLAMLTEPLAAVRSRARRVLRRLAPDVRRASGRRASPTISPRWAAAPCRPSSCRPWRSPSGRARRPRCGSTRRCACGDPPVVGRITPRPPLSRLPDGAARAGEGSRPGADHRGGPPVSEATPKHVVVGTAGHIDHGKTSLVKALTGIDTDRLPEEKARGHHDRSGIRLPRGAGRAHHRDRRRPGARALRQEHAGRRRRYRPGDAGHRGRRRRDAPDARAPRDLLALAHQGRTHRADQGRSGRAGLARAGTGGRGGRGPRHVSRGRADSPGVRQDGPGARRPPRRASRPRGSRCPSAGPISSRVFPIDRVFTVKGFGTVVTGTLTAGRARRRRPCRGLSAKDRGQDSGAADPRSSGDLGPSGTAHRGQPAGARAGRDRPR